MENETQEISGKEAYETKKKEKEIGRVKESRTQGAIDGSRKAVRLFLILIILVAVIGGVVWWLSTLGPEGEDRSVSLDSLGREHISDDALRPEYNSNPPTSGPHFTTPAHGGFREEDIPDENIVHSLEHGFVWISYQSDVPNEVVDQLKDFAGDMVIVTKRDANDTDIAVAAWTRLNKWDLPEDGTLDAGRIEDFIIRYLNHGPERVGSSHGGI